MKLTGDSVAKVFIGIIISINSLQLCSAEDSYLNWQSIKLQDGGSIKLPSNFSAIGADFGLEKSSDDDITTYSQRLLNAKGVSNNIVCSVKMSRLWKEKIEGNLITEDAPQEYLQKYSQKQLDAVLSLGAYTLHKPLKFEKLGENLFCRYSLLLNNGESRLDGFSCYQNGFLFHGSAAYRKIEEKYWSSTFTDILKTWQPGKLRDKTKAVSDASYKNTQVWQDHELDGGSKIWLPKNWLCIYKNSTPEKEDVFLKLYTGYFQVLMNARSSLYEGDVSTFQLFRFFMKNNLSGEIEGLEAEDLSEYEKEFVDTLSESFADLAKIKMVSRPTIHKISNKEIMTRTYSAIFPFGTNYIQTYAFIENGSFYILMLNHPAKDKDLWHDLMTSIFNRWEFPSKKAALAISDEIAVLSDYNQPESPYLYKNHQSHFSLRVPGNWIQIPEANLKEYIAAINEATNSPTKYEYLAGFQQASDVFFAYPYFLIQTTDTGGAPPEMIEELFSSDEGKGLLEQGITEAKDKMKNIASNLSFGISSIDRERHLIFNTTTSDVIGVGKVRGNSAGFIGKEAIVWLHFYSLDEDFDFYKNKYFDQILNSFEYDIAYRFIKASNGTLENVSNLIDEEKYVGKDIQNPTGNLKTVGSAVAILCICFVVLIIILAKRKKRLGDSIDVMPGYTGDMGDGYSKSTEFDSQTIESYIEKELEKKATVNTQNIKHTPLMQSEIMSQDNSSIAEMETGKGLNGTGNDLNKVDGQKFSIPLKLGVLTECKNCERTIGKLETSFKFKSNVICLQCNHKLKNQC